MSEANQTERVKGRLLVDKYSPSKGSLYALAGTTVYLIEYRGTVALVKDEDGNSFSAQCSEVYFGAGDIAIEPSKPRENYGPAENKKKSGRKVAAEQTPTLF